MVLNFASTKELLTKKYEFTIICNYVYWRCFLGVTSIKDIKQLGGGGVTHGWMDSEKKLLWGHLHQKGARNSKAGSTKSHQKRLETTRIS